MNRYSFPIRVRSGAGEYRSMLRLSLALALVSSVLAASASAATIVRGPSANGSTVRAHAGDALVVRLPGNPTTGYRWSVVRLPASLRLVRAAYHPPAQRRLGQGGTYVFRFAVRFGHGTIRLGYSRPWETTKPPLRTFTLTVRASRV